MLLARLAVDKHWQGLGIGRQLLVDAMQRFAALSADVGFEVVVVDAIDDEQLASQAVSLSQAVIELRAAEAEIAVINHHLGL